MVAGGLIGVLGRRNAVRSARLVLNEARFDIPNDMASNGERLLQETVAAAWQRQPLVVLDVGANVGDWSNQLLAILARAGVSGCTLHVIEPAPQTAALLRTRLPRSDGRVSIEIHELALSSREGHQTLYVPEAGAGTSSLHCMTPEQRDNPCNTSVTVTTVDAFCARHGLEEITLCKTDVEGHDLEVLLGASELLASQRIGIWQFEYNWRWVMARRFLRDAFEIADAHGYRLGKLTPHGVEYYPRWSFELESFWEGNYVLCRPDWVERLPRVRWWNDPA